MTTSTDIVNIALRRVGAVRISSLATDSVKEAVTARDLYDEARRDLLASHTWNFATKRARLQSSVAADIAATPAFGWDYAYIMPDDFLRMVSVHPSDAESASIEYRLEFQEDKDRVLLCNSTEVYIKYIFDLEDVNVMSASFRDVLAWRCARDLAAALSKSASAAEMADNAMRRQLARAKSVEGIEDFPDTMAEGDWSKSRFGGGL